MITYEPRRTIERLLVLTFAVVIAFSNLYFSSLHALVTTYPAPSGMSLSTAYRLLADGNRVDIYACQSAQNGAYQFAYFSFSDSVQIKVVASSLANAKIMPESYNIARHMNGDTLVFTLYSPQSVTVTPGACSGALHIFADPLETNVPSQSDPNVQYYGPGLQSTNVSVSSNKTLYLAGGAVISGNVQVSGSNITVRGRGVIQGALQINSSTNVRVHDIIMKGSTGWTIVPRGCDSVSIINAHICNGQQPNEDGIDIVNSTRIYIADCFIRTDDDNIAIKGMDASKHCSDILAERCQLWTDRARNVLIGFESEIVDRSFHDMAFKNMEVLYSPSNTTTSDYWGLSVFFLQPCDLTGVERITVEDWNINGSPCMLNHLFRIMPDLRTGWGWNGTEQGKYIKNCLFKNIHVNGTASGTSGVPSIYIVGAAADHYVDSIAFVNVTRYGACVQRNSPGVTIGNYTSNLTFTCEPGTYNSVAISPANNSVKSGQSVQLSAQAVDQYGIAVSPQPTTFNWNVSGGGTISSSGLFTAGSVERSVPDTVRVSATINNVTKNGTALVYVTEKTMLTSIRYYPRQSFASRMVGGIFEASTVDKDNGPYTTLATITSTPPENAWTEITSFANTVSNYKYLRYRSPDNSYGNVAEIEFLINYTKAAGTPFGTPGSYNNSGYDYTRAFDNNTATYFDYSQASGGYTGLTVESGATRISPLTGEKEFLKPVMVKMAGNALHISVDQPGRHSVRIVDVSGRCIKSFTGTGSQAYVLPIKGINARILFAMVTVNGVESSIKRVVCY